MTAPVFTETIQIAVVVRDLDAAMRTYVHDYGIGPWADPNVWVSLGDPREAPAMVSAR